MIFPPIGFLGSAANMAAPSTCATTWLVITTATPNCKGKNNQGKAMCFPQSEHRKKKKKGEKKPPEMCTSAALSAVHNYPTVHLKPQRKQTLSGQKAISTKLLSFTRGTKPITSPLETKAKPTAYLIRKSQKHAQKSGQMHLPCCQLPSPRVIRAVQGRGTVHDQQRVPAEERHEERPCWGVTELSTS